MQRTMPEAVQLNRSATVFRLLTIALATLAVVLGGQIIDPRLLPLGAIYLVTTGIFWLLGSRMARASHVIPAVAVDIGALTALIALVPASPLPLWVLYLTAIAGAAAVGRIPAIVAAVLSAAGYLGVVWFSTGTLSIAVAWPVAVLVAYTIVSTVLTTRWLVERHEKRAWQEIAASARALDSRGDVDDVAASVVEQARRLVRARGAGLWWCDADDKLTPGPRVGPASDFPVLPQILPSVLSRRLDRGPVQLAEFGGPAADLIGEVLALRSDGTRVALLEVRWPAAPGDYTERRERLRVFAHWAAETLGQARARAAAREMLRRATVLQQAAGDLAGTVERQVIQDLIIRAARTGLGVVASLVERSSGRVLAGDPEVANALVRWTVGGRTVSVDADATIADAKAPLATMVGEDLALLAWRATSPLGESDAAWLEQLAAVARVVLQQSAAYEDLRAAERRLDACLEALPAPVSLWDSSGETVLANSSYRALGLITTPPRELPPDGIHEQEIVVGDPMRTFVAMTTTLADGQYVVSALREITRERQALQAKDDLISLVGHELRSPLATIHGYSQLMARQLGLVQQQVGQLNQLIGDFMDASRLEGGQLPLERHPVEITSLVRKAAEHFRAAHDGRVLRLQLPDSVPLVEGDSTRLGQVLDNLLSNAAKYSPAETEIVLLIDVFDGQVRVAVKDRGVGIAPEHLPHLFTRFYRVPSAGTERVTGYGLGLSIVRDLVAAHGGRVWAESAGLGQGSTFWVSLPVFSPNKTSALETLGTG